MITAYRLYRTVWLFLRIVWRRWENEHSGIPDDYRFRVRLDIRSAWSIARRVWG